MGERLRKARESRGMTLEDVEAVTKVRARFLAAIEEERFDLLPAQVYGRGFIRLYARAVGLDESVLLSSFAHVLPPDRSTVLAKPILEVPIEPAASRSWWRRYVMYAATIVVGAAVVVLYVGVAQIRQFTQPLPPASAPAGQTAQPGQAPQMAGPTPQSQPGQTGEPGPAAQPGSSGPPGATQSDAPQPGAAPSGSPIQPSPSAPSAPSAPAASAPSTSPPAPQVPSGPSAQPAQPAPGSPPPRDAPSVPPATQGAPSTASGTAPSPSSRVTLAVRASGRSWLRVEVDGVQAFVGFTAAGDSRSWHGRQYILVRAGNAGVLGVSVNGRPVRFGQLGEVVEYRYTP
ncbi:MAG: helix-turn-helix domain-containing protein [Armatimonadetes bacterium]|nr:helix-turn-helix domain-containing protein [Armatimonadota bacterium]